MDQPQASPAIPGIPDTSSDSGRNFEAALPAQTPLSPQDSLRRTPGLPVANGVETLLEMDNANLAEPQGELSTSAPAPQPSANPQSAQFLPSFPVSLTTKIDADFEHLLETVHLNRPADDLEIIRTAWQFCLSQHAGQKRASGEPYVIHPLEVGQVLAEMKMDSTAIAAGLLHDAVEDTDVSAPEISQRFGPQVAHIVDGVTKLDRIKFANKEDHQAENIRKMLLAMVSDIRVVLIKMADRLHNMRTLAHLRPDKQVRIAKETLEIYAPLAHRLGMGKLRGEFEDLAFQYVDPERYLQLAQDVELLRNRGGSEFLSTIADRLNLELTRHGLPGRVEFRIKRLYSINQKLQDHASEGGSS
ncbi:MAG TPA: HD domain-containing protein, partial [Edaphobacter sp.]